MSSCSSRRSRFRVRIPDEDPTAADLEPREYEADLEPMTAKGIKRLCSELMELKKASNEDFQRNVYFSYSSFLRVFEEIGGVESEILELKKHASTQTKLIQAVTSNFYAEMVVDGSKETEVVYPDLSLPNEFGIHMQDSLVTLDILLSECQLEEALVVLGEEILALQQLQIQEDSSSPITMSYAYALSERNIVLADQLASMAEHPRVCQPELQKALSGLCRLGENHRANSILIKFYRSRLQKKVHELQCSKSCLYGTYIREVTKAVFSSISQAARCFATLYGETYTYCSELILWAREETETFSHNFCTYIRSISEMSGGLSLAAEAANSAISLCSLLKSQRIVLLSNLVELIRPCMEELLQMHADHFKEVVHIFTTTDNWTLGKFLIMGILRDKLSLTGIGEKVEYCLLTSSGRKFATLMQAIVDDISPLVILRMESSILNGLADLFSEYMSALERAIPSRGNTENGSPNVSSAQTLEQQLSILVNASTLVRIFPSIAGSIFKGTKSSNSILSEQTENFSQNELGDCILSIEEVVDQLRCYFCMQFVVGIMSRVDFESTNFFNDWCIPSSLQDPMPSLAFQVLFEQLRQVEQLVESLFVGEDGVMEKLPKEIVEIAIDWLSNNQDFWPKTVARSCIRHCSFLEQVCLDVYFVVEIATLGGYCSDDLFDAAMDLIEEMEVAFTKTGSDPYGVLPDRDWAQNAAKLAIKKLLEADDVNLEPKVETEAISLEQLRIHNWEDEYPFGVEDSTVLVDSGSENLVDDGVARLLEIKDVVPKSFDVQTSDDNYDNDGSRSPTVPDCDRRDGEDGDKADSGTDGLSEGEDLEELGLERLTIKDELQSVGNYDGLNEIIENSKLREQKDTEEVAAERITTNREGHSVSSLDESDAIATQLTLEGQQYISNKENVVMVNDLEAVRFKEREGKKELIEEEHTAYPEMKSIDNLQEFDGIVPQLATDEPLDIAEKENVLQETELLQADRLTEVEGIEDLDVEGLCTYPQLKSVDKLDGSDAIVAQAVVKEPQYNTEKSDLLIDRKLINDPDARISVEVDNYPEDLVGLVLREGNDDSLTLSMEPVQLDISNVEGKQTLLETQSIHDEDPSDLSNLILATRLRKHGGDGIIPVDDCGNTSNSSPRQSVVRKQYLLNSGKNGMNSKELGSKTFSNVKNPSAIDKSELEIEQSIVEVQGIEDGNKLLSDNISQLIFATTQPKQRKVCVIHLVGSENISIGSPRQRVVVKNRSKTDAPTLVRNEKASNWSDSKTSPEVHNPSNVLVKSMKVDPEKKLVLHEEHTTENKTTLLEADDIVQVDGSTVIDETSTRMPLKNEEEKLLSGKLSELVIETRNNPAGRDGNTSGDLVRQRSGRKRTKSNVDENMVMSGKVAKALRPQWH